MTVRARENSINNKSQFYDYIFLHSDFALSFKDCFASHACYRSVQE